MSLLLATLHDNDLTNLLASSNFTTISVAICQRQWRDVDVLITEAAAVVELMQ